MERAEYQGPERAVMYTIPVDLTLQDDGLTVNVDAAKILAPGKQKLRRIGAVGTVISFRINQIVIQRSNKIAGGPINRPTAADEYMLIPDGSGALIEFNNQKSSYGAYSQIHHYGAP